MSSIELVALCPDEDSRGKTYVPALVQSTVLYIMEAARFVGMNHEPVSKEQEAMWVLLRRGVQEPKYQTYAFHIVEAALIRLSVFSMGDRPPIMTGGLRRLAEEQSCKLPINMKGYVQRRLGIPPQSTKRTLPVLTKEGREEAVNLGRALARLVQVHHEDALGISDVDRDMRDAERDWLLYHLDRMPKTTDPGMRELAFRRMLAESVGWSVPPIEERNMTLTARPLDMLTKWAAGIDAKRVRRMV